MTSFAEIGSLHELASLLGQYEQLAYLILFLGALFETLVPFSLIVLGEVFFLSGALLAGIGVLDIWGVMAVLYGGGILGDNLSYWIGRRYGTTLFERLERWPIIRRFINAQSYQRGQIFFQQRGAVAVLTARLSGPMSWITPAMAGIFRLDYVTFFRFNAVGVIIGISEFIVIGYFFGAYLPAILAWLDQYSFTILTLVILILLSSIWLWRFRVAKVERVYGEK